MTAQYELNRHGEARIQEELAPAVKLRALCDAFVKQLVDMQAEYAMHGFPQSPSHTTDVHNDVSYTLVNIMEAVDNHLHDYCPQPDRLEDEMADRLIGEPEYRQRADDLSTIRI